MENMNTQLQFHWLSPLGVSVMLFIFYGAFYMLIGGLTPFFIEKNLEKQGVIMSYRPDKLLFGEEPGKMLDVDKPIRKLRNIILAMLAAMLVVSGFMIVSTAWFGLRAGQTWALIALSIVGLIVLPFWWLVFKPYLNAGIKITLADAPPFIWVPAVLYLPAVILGWIGLTK